MITNFIVFLFLGFLSIVVIYFFLWVFVKSIYDRFTTTMNGFSSLQTDLCFLRERIETLLDELDKKGNNKNLNDINKDDREERWNRIRKAFEKKEQDQDGSN